MNILVIHEVSYLKKPVYEYQDFAERLAARGHQVTVIDFNEAEIMPFSCQRVCRTGLHEIDLMSLPNSGVPVIKYIQARMHFGSLLPKLVQEKKIDAILLYSVFINGYSALRFAKAAQVRVVYRVLDAYHKLRSNRLESWLLAIAEKYIYRHANVLSVTNAKMADYVVEMALPGKPHQIRVTDHGVDTEHFCKEQANTDLQKRFGISDADFVCVFLGTTYSFSRLDLLIGYIRVIAQEIPGFKLLVMGAGELDQAIQKAVAEAGVEGDVICPGMVAYADLPAYLSLAHIAINPFEINDITRDIIPIKILQYMAAQLPVVATPLPDLVKKIPPGMSGIEYSPSDGMDDFVETLIANARRIDLAERGLQARRYVSQWHSMNRVIDELEGLLGK